MALKYIIDALVEVPGPLRTEYAKASDGKYHLQVEGHPDTTRLAEFRATNVALLKEKTELATKLAAFDGIDAAAAKAALARPTGDDPQLVDLKLKLAAAEATAATAAIERDALAFRRAVSDVALAAGVRKDAVDYVCGKVPFTLVDGALKPKEGEQSPTIEEWLLDQSVGALAFVFEPNRGGGARGAKPDAVLGARSNVREIVNPSPQQLGDPNTAADIKAGRARVVITT